MRAVFITMMVLAVLVTGCKKETQQQSAKQKAAAATSLTPAVTETAYQPNTLIAPLSEEAAKSPKRILVETTFNCSDKTKFTARFMPDDMEINGGWRTGILLQKQSVASGFWYKNAQYELRGKGRQATLTIQGRKPVTCSDARR